MSTPTNAPAASATRLFQVLTFWDLVVYGLAYVSPIGPWGTFGFAYGLSGGLVVLVFAVGALVLSFTASSYAQMCTAVPGAGSVFSYARYSMGETVGFLAGWMVLLDYLLIPALMYVLCAVILSVYSPGIPRWVWVLLVAGYNLGVNWFGIKTSARFNLGTLILQFILLGVVLAASWFVLHRSGAPMFTMDGWWRPTAHLSGVFAGASLCVMAYLGFDAITTLSEEVRPEQKRLIGRAIIFSMFALGLLAVLDVWTLSDLSRGYEFKDPAAAVYDVIGARITPTFGGFVTWAVGFIVAVSITPPMVTAVARVLYAMALEGELPRLLARLHPRHGVPHIALIASGALSVAIALVFVDQADTLTSMVNVGALCAFIAVNLSVIALFVVKRRSRQWIIHLLLPLLGIATILAVMSQMSVIGLSVGSAWLLLGAAGYIVRRLRNKQDLRPSVN